MLQLKNRTPFQATLLLTPDADGIESLYVIVKGTYDLTTTTVRLADKQGGPRSPG